MKDTIECYKVLDVEPGSSAERIRRAYVDLVRTWDPDRYIGNPLLQEEATKKRAEIEEAYQAIKFFLPGLQDLTGEGEKRAERIRRDFKELARRPVGESSKAVLGILAALVFLLSFAFAYYLMVKGRAAVPAASTQTVPLE